MTADPIEYNLDISSENAQWTLHDENETIVQFSTIVNQVPCTVRLIFKPFRRPGCNLIYHEYEIRCIIPLGASTEAVSCSKHSITTEAQRLYIKYFAKAGCKLVLETEVEVSSKSSPGSEVTSNLVTNHRAKHHLTSINEHLSKRQKSLQADRPPGVDTEPIPWTAEILNHGVQQTQPSAVPPKSSAVSLTWVDKSPIEAVQESYLSAIQDGRLKYDRVPQQVSESAGLKPWDPYVLTVPSVPRARLDSDKVESIARSVESIIRRVPKAVEWIAKTQKHRLTPEDVKMILRRAFFGLSSSIQQPEQVGKLPPVLGIAAKALRRAQELKDEAGDFRREEEILRMVAYAAIEVSVVAKEVTDDEVDRWIGELAGEKDWLRRSRRLARLLCWAMANLKGWEGRYLPLFFILVDERGELPLRNLFQPVFPASAGEFVSALSSEVYWKGLPALTRLPGLIEIEMVLLGPYVEHEIIGFALGCPIEYLKGLDLNLFSDLYKKDEGRDIGANIDPFLSAEYNVDKDFDALFCRNFDTADSPTYQQ